MVRRVFAANTFADSLMDHNNADYLTAIEYERPCLISKLSNKFFFHSGFVSCQRIVQTVY